MDTLIRRLSSYFLPVSLHGLNVRWEDVVEIIIISFLIYQIMAWVRHTKVWLLMKGIVIILVFVFLAIIFRMNTIIWMVENVLSLAVIAMIVILQPELRRALEELGRKNFITNLLSFEKTVSERFSDKTVNDLVKASFEMGKVKTGALIVSTYLIQVLIGLVIALILTFTFMPDFFPASGILLDRKSVV